NLDGEYLGCNQAFATDVGLTSPEEIVGKTDAQLSRIDSSLRSPPAFESAVQTAGRVLNAEFQTTSVDGRQRWLCANTIPVLDSQRRSFGVLGTYEDVTERKRAEDAIKRSNAELAEFAHVVSH